MTASKEKIILWEYESGKSLYGHNNTAEESGKYYSFTANIFFTKGAKEYILVEFNKIKLYATVSGDLIREIPMKLNDEYISESYYDKEKDQLILFTSKQRLVGYKILADEKSFNHLLDFSHGDYSEFSMDYAFNQDKSQILIAEMNYCLPENSDHRNTCKLFSVDNGKLLDSYSIGIMEEAETYGYVTKIYFSEEKMYALVLVSTNRYVVWDLKAGKIAADLKCEHPFHYGTVFSTNGSQIYSAHTDGSIKVWDIEDSKLVKELKYTDEIILDENQQEYWSQILMEYEISIQPGKYGKFLAVIDDGRPRLFDLETGHIDHYLGVIRSYGVKDNCSNATFGSEMLTLRLIDNNRLRIHDLTSTARVKKYAGSVPAIYAVEYDRGCGEIRVETGTEIKKWNIETMEHISTETESVDYDYDQHPTETIKIMDLSGKKRKVLKTGSSPMGEYMYEYTAQKSNSPSGFMVFYNDKGEIWERGIASTSDWRDTLIGIFSLKPIPMKIRSAIDGSSLFTIKANKVVFDDSGRYMISYNSKEPKCKLWDLENRQLIYEPDKAFFILAYRKTDFYFGRSESTIDDFHYDQDNKMIVVGNGLQVWDCEKERFHFEATKLLDSNNRYSLLVEEVYIGKNHLTVLDKKDMSIHRILRDSPGNYYHINWEDSIIVMEHNSLLTLHNIFTEEELISLAYIGTSDWAVTHPSGLFDASPGAMKRLYFVQGLDIIEFDQLKDVYYEPGLWGKVMGYNSEAIRKVQELSALKLHPLVYLTSPEDGKYIVQLQPREGGVGDVKLYINNKLTDCKPLNKEQTEDGAFISLFYDISDHPFLIPGEKNKIRVNAYNEGNWLRSRDAVRTYTPEIKKGIVKPSMHAIIVGVSDYSGEALDLKFASKDAKDFASALGLTAKTLFGLEQVNITLLNTEADSDLPSKENILSAFHDVASVSAPGDILLLYFAGHGTSLSGENSDFYYLTSDASSGDLSIPEIRKSITISGKEITELVSHISANKQVLILDACHSGKFADDLMSFRADISSSVARSFEKMKDNTGMFIISGSAADAVSYETSIYGQGLLTYSLIFGMKGAATNYGGFVDVSTLFQHAADDVPRLAENIGGIQKPQVRTPKGGQSFSIGIVTPEIQEQIVLKEPLPLFLQSSFQDDLTMADILNLSEEVDQVLLESSIMEGKRELVFVNARNYPNAFNINGRYVQEGESTYAEVALIRNSKLVKRFDMSGSSVEDLAPKIIKEALMYASKAEN